MAALRKKADTGAVMPEAAEFFKGYHNWAEKEVEWLSNITEKEPLIDYGADDQRLTVMMRSASNLSNLSRHKTLVSL